MNLTLEGKQGKTVIVAGDSIRIQNKGMLTGMREKTLPIRNITSVEVKKPGGFAGFLQFSVAGGAARDSSYMVSGGAIDAAKDENSILFTGKDKYETALKIKAHVEEWSAKQHSGSPSAAPTSVSDEIRKLKALCDEGLITPEQFEAKKKQMLGL